MSVTSADREAILARLSSLAGVGAEHAIVFVHEGRPIPKARARWSPRNNRWYTPTTTEKAEEAIAWLFKRALARRQTFKDTVAIVALFFVATRQRKDLDNLMKLVMDAGNQAQAWKDDSQVVAQAAQLELDIEHPRTVVALCPTLGTLTRAPLLLERMD